MSKAFGSEDPQDELIPSQPQRRPVGTQASAGSALSVDDLNLKVQQAEEDEEPRAVPPPRGAVAEDGGGAVFLDGEGGVLLAAAGGTGLG
ncbi:MAG TPA: hypothetical protein VIM58_04365, partial [Candidatus Methylacidiphilales bacterium]